MLPKKFYWRGLHTLGVIGLILLALGVTPFTAYSQDPEWSMPIQLSEPDKFSWFPHVVTDLAGGVHVMWASSREVTESKYAGYDTAIYCQMTNTGCQEIAEVAAMPQSAGEFNTRPAAVVDGKGTLHMLWRGETVIFYTSASIIEPISTRRWSPAQRISGSSTAYYLDIAQDQQGVLHAVWSENLPSNEFQDCVACSDIFYRQSTDLGRNWSAPVRLSKTDWASEKPHIVIGPDELIYVAWEEGYDFYVGQGEPKSSMMIASKDGGLTWGEPTTFIFPDDAPQSIAAGVDSQGKLLVVWQQVVDDGIFYQVSTDRGQSWSMPQQIQGVTTRAVYNDLDDFDMAADSAGYLHLVLVGQNPELVAATEEQPDTFAPNSVYHLEWDGVAWSEPLPIFTPIRNDMPEWPRIAVASGNQLHVVWFLRDEAHVSASDGGKYQVWYAQGRSSVPSVSPIAWPTPTSTPTLERDATSVPTPTPMNTPTPIPTLDPSLAQIVVSPEVTQSIYSDADEIFLLAKSLLPVVLITVLVIVGVRFWRR